MASLRATARPILRDPPVTIATGVLAVLCAFVITPPLWPRCPAVAQGHLPGRRPGLCGALPLGLGLRDGRPAPAGVSGPVRGARCAGPSARDCARGPERGPTHPR